MKANNLLLGVARTIPSQSSTIAIQKLEIHYYCTLSLKGEIHIDTNNINDNDRICLLFEIQKSWCIKNGMDCHWCTYRYRAIRTDSWDYRLLNK